MNRIFVFLEAHFPQKAVSFSLLVPQVQLDSKSNDWNISVELIKDRGQRIPNDLSIIVLILELNSILISIFVKIS